MTEVGSHRSGYQHPHLEQELRFRPDRAILVHEALGCRRENPNPAIEQAGHGMGDSLSTQGLSMSHSQWRIKPSEIARTVRSLQKAGLHVRNVEITRDGTIRVSVTEPEALLEDATKPEPGEWD
jgi:hypothetical protein